MVKEKGFNPVQAQRKADKAKEIKKGKAEVQARRNERLARRNPEGIQRQVDELKKVTEGGGKLTRHEEQVLEGLEKELKAVVKAREALGDRAPQFDSSRGPPREGGDDRRGGALGKRRRGDGDDDEAVAGGRWRGGRGRESDSDSDEVPDGVRAIPMPRDTPPPIPKEVLDRWWARRRAKRGGGGGGGGGRGGGNAGAGAGAGAGSSANAEPLVNDRGLGGGDGDGAAQRQGRLPQRPAAAAAEPKVVYEAKPVVRNLLKEATSAFVPAAVATKLAMGKGEGGRLMEPEEADRLESEGYMKTTAAAEDEEQAASRLHQVTLEEVADEDEGM
ncbi:hypothetical protein RB595_010015 [Gaeumannomyces hyphopodioides]